MRFSVKDVYFITRDKGEGMRNIYARGRHSVNVTLSQRAVKRRPLSAIAGHIHEVATHCGLSGELMRR